MPDEVKIPVGVKGAEEAQQTLRRVSIQLTELEEAEFRRWRASQQRADDRGVAERASLEAAARSRAVNELAAAEALRLDEVGRAAGRAGDATIDFHRKGEKLAKEVLALLNPELARMADFALDATQGISKLSPALLAVAGAGAGIGLLVTFLRQAAEEAERAERGIRGAIAAAAEQRGEGAALRETMAGKLGEMGVFGGADAAVRSVQRLMRAGVDRETAEAAAAAAVAGELTPEQEMDAAAAALAGRLPAAEKLRGMDESRRRAAVARAVAGVTPQERTALGGRILDTGDLARAQAPSDEALAREGSDEWIARFRRELGLNEKDVEIIRRVAGLGRAATDADVRRIFAPNIQWWERAGAAGGPILPWIRDETAEGGTRTVRELLDLAMQARSQGAARETGEAWARAFGGPVHVQVTNINTQHNERDPMSIRPSQSPEMQIQSASWR